ncbi:ComEA family DNA-binding protein [Streptomyces sp. NBC_00388]|uniref:ComEA family DNA-binding protein n=1 Tax=Streptomyces sp. NBC_00388 TaxID=2975735 RepID=UPI002E238AC7
MTPRTLTSRSATSGPGRAPASDGRARLGRHPRRPRQTGARRRGPAGRERAQPDDALRLRAAVLFPGGSAVPKVPLTGAPTGSGGAASDEGDARGVAEGGARKAGDAPGRRVPQGGVARGARAVRDAGGAPQDEGASGDGGGPAGGRAAAAAARAGEALRERLPLWVQAHCGLTPRTLAALAVVLVAAAALALQQFWTGRPQPVRAPAVVSAGLPAGPRAAADDRLPPGSRPSPSPGPPPSTGPLPASGAGPAQAGAAAARIVVDVSGRVRRPGIQRLPAGSRVADALRAAGGVRDGTDTSALNQARVLTDGEQVLVGGPAAAGAPAPGVPATGATGGSTGGGTAGATGSTASAAVPVSLSTATVEQLDTLPGVGPVLAQHIVDYRTEHGGFTSVGELRQVTGIGDRRFSDLQPLVRP